VDSHLRKKIILLPLGILGGRSLVLVGDIFLFDAFFIERHELDFSVELADVLLQLNNQRSVSEMNIVDYVHLSEAALAQLLSDFVPVFEDDASDILLLMDLFDLLVLEFLIVDAQERGEVGLEVSHWGNLAWL